MLENEDRLIERAREVSCHTKQLILEAERLHTQSSRLIANAKILGAEMQEKTQNEKRSSSYPRPQSVPE